MAKSKHGRGARLIMDIGIFAFGNLLVKVIQFLLLPFYTSTLSPSEYGTAELVFNFSQLMLPIATLSMTNAIFQYAAENADSKKLLSSGLFVSLVGVSVVAFGAFLFNLFKPIHYVGFFCVLLLGEALKSVLASITRGLGNSKRFAMGGPVDVLVLSVSNIVLIGFLKLGALGYLYSLVVSNYTTAFYYFLASRLYRYIRLDQIDKTMMRALVVFGVPMMLHNVIWWFVNMSGRYIILWRGGEALAGCYIAVSKLPAIINLAATIFQQAWQYSTAKEVNNESSEEFFSDVFRYFSYFCLCCAALVVAFCPQLADLMLKKEFRSGGAWLPILLTVGLVNCFSVFFLTFYNAYKRNAMVFVSSLVGAIVSVGLSYWFNRLWGPMGVAIGSLAGFVASTLIRVVDVQARFVKLTYRLAPLFSVMTLYALEVVAQTLNQPLISWILCVLQIAIVVVSERKNLARLPRLVQERIAARRRVH